MKAEGFRRPPGSGWRRLALAAALLALGSGCRPQVPETAGPDQVTLPRAAVPQTPQLQTPQLQTSGTRQVTPSLITRRADGCLNHAPVVAKAPAPPLPLSGRLGLWVAQIDPRTLEPVRAVGTNPDSVFPLASAYKQAVLWALLKEFDQGRISPTERFSVTRQNQSLGAYPFDGMTVRALSARMIGVSDNTATDILHRRVGLQRVQNVADELGLCLTRLILPTRAWWVAQAGLSSTFNGTHLWAGARGQQREQLARQIDGDAQAYRSDYVQRRLDVYFDHRHVPEDDLRAHNLSTPYEFSTLIAHEFLRPGLSSRAQNWHREVMGAGLGRSALKAGREGRVEWLGGKGGNGWRILTYSGYFQTTDGRHVVFAFMQHGAQQTYTMPGSRRAFAWINAGIDAVLGPPARPASGRTGTR